MIADRCVSKCRVRTLRQFTHQDVALVLALGQWLA